MCMSCCVGKSLYQPHWSLLRYRSTEAAAAIFASNAILTHLKQTRGQQSKSEEILWGSGGYQGDKVHNVEASNRMNINHASWTGSFQQEVALHSRFMYIWKYLRWVNVKTELWPTIKKTIIFLLRITLQLLKLPLFYEVISWSDAVTEIEVDTRTEQYFLLTELL